MEAHAAEALEEVVVADMAVADHHMEAVAEVAMAVVVMDPHGAAGTAVATDQEEATNPAHTSAQVFLRPVSAHQSFGMSDIFKVWSGEHVYDGHDLGQSWVCG